MPLARRLRPCEAKITHGIVAGALRHSHGRPIWSGGTRGEAEVLGMLSQSLRLRWIISSRASRFPPSVAALTVIQFPTPPASRCKQPPISCAIPFNRKVTLSLPARVEDAYRAALGMARDLPIYELEEKSSRLRTAAAPDSAGPDRLGKIDPGPTDFFSITDCSARVRSVILSHAARGTSARVARGGGAEGATWRRSRYQIRFENVRLKTRRVSASSRKGFSCAS